MKRTILAIAIGVVTFGATYGLSASLNLTSDSLGAATTTVAACQAGALTSTWTPTYSASTPGYTVGTVTITGLASTCYGKAYRVTVSGSGGTSLGESTGTTPSSGSSFAVTLSPAVGAALITGINVVISG